MLFLSLTAHSQRKLSLPHLPRYWLSSHTKRYVTADNGFSGPLPVAALVTLLSTRYVVPPMSPFQSGPSVALRRGRAYAHVGGVAAQVLSWASSALASSKSLRMIAVIATFGGLPAWQSWRYFRARSGLQAIAETAGM